MRIGAIKELILLATSIAANSRGTAVVVVILLATLHFRVFPTLVQEYDTLLTTRVAPAFVHFVQCTWGEFAASTGTDIATTATIGNTAVTLRTALRNRARIFLLYR
jgi:hypothetical protein